MAGCFECDTCCWSAKGRASRLRHKTAVMMSTISLTRERVVDLIVHSLLILSLHDLSITDPPLPRQGRLIGCIDVKNLLYSCLCLAVVASIPECLNLRQQRSNLLCICFGVARRFVR